jgi:hypothetical protein
MSCRSEMDNQDEIHLARHKLSKLSSTADTRKWQIERRKKDANWGANS